MLNIAEQTAVSRTGEEDLVAQIIRRIDAALKELDDVAVTAVDRRLVGG